MSIWKDSLHQVSDMFTKRDIFMKGCLSEQQGTGEVKTHNEWPPGKLGVPLIGIRFCCSLLGSPAALNLPCDYRV